MFASLECFLRGKNIWRKCTLIVKCLLVYFYILLWRIVINVCFEKHLPSAINIIHCKRASRYFLFHIILFIFISLSHSMLESLFCIHSECALLYIYFFWFVFIFFILFFFCWLYFPHFIIFGVMQVKMTC